MLLKSKFRHLGYEKSRVALENVINYRKERPLDYVTVVVLLLLNLVLANSLAGRKIYAFLMR